MNSVSAESSFSSILPFPASSFFHPSRSHLLNIEKSPFHFYLIFEGYVSSICVCGMCCTMQACECTMCAPVLLQQRSEQAVRCLPRFLSLLYFIFLRQSISQNYKLVSLARLTACLFFSSGLQACSAMTNFSHA